MKKKMSILAALVLAVIVTGYSVSGTYAKYTSTFNGKTSTARVAKWAVSASDLDLSSGAEEKFTFNLFESVNDANVKNGENENIIAPGTKGYFDLTIANNSEVKAEYTVAYTVDNKNVPLEFSVGTTTSSEDSLTWTTGLSPVTATELNQGATETIRIYWRWAFTGSASSQYTTTQTDGTDTTLGIAGTATPTVSAVVTVSQVD